ncbi:MAG: hypothetical protein U0324_32550 [Polyangiales bacterium]
MARVAVAGEGAVDGGGDARGDVGAQRAERRRVGGEDGGEGLVVAVADEGGPAGEGFEEDHPESPHVDARVEIAGAAALLGGHVAGGADDLAGAGEGPVGRVGAGDAEVDDARGLAAGGVAGEEDVLGLEVAVDDAAAVGLGDALHRGRDERERLRRWERAAPFEHRAQRLAVEELVHDEQPHAVGVVAHVEHVDHVGVAHLRRRLRLSQEALDAVGRGRPARALPVAVHHLHRDAALRPGVGGLPHRPHAAAARDAGEAVAAADHGAGRERRRPCSLRA